MSRRRIIYSFLIAPLDPAYKAGLASAPPVKFAEINPERIIGMHTLGTIRNSLDD
jgi:hypothetical protein